MDQQQQGASRRQANATALRGGSNSPATSSASPGVRRAASRRENKCRVEAALAALGEDATKEQNARTPRTPRSPRWTGASHAGHGQPQNEKEEKKQPLSEKRTW